MFEYLAPLDPSTDQSALIERIAELERVKSAAAAGVPAARRGRGVAGEVALARRDSPARGSRHLGFAKALVHEMPHTLAALESGTLSEWRATLIVRESACLDVDDRRTLDAEMCGDPARLNGMGDARVAAAAKAIAYRLDPHAVVDRAAKAENERTVTIRPAPDTMTYLTALLPVAQGVAAYAALRREADTRCDGRSRGQVMADTLVECVTGRDAAVPVPVAVNLVLSDETLLGGSDAPADISGYGPIPAAGARAMVSSGVADRRSRATLRRLYAHPRSGALVTMESRARLSRAAWPPSSSSVTSGAAPPTATRRSGTATTPNHGPRAAPPPRATVSACASAATTRSKAPAGESAQAPTKPTRTQPNSRYRRARPTGPRRHRGRRRSCSAMSSSESGSRSRSTPRRKTHPWPVRCSTSMTSPRLMLTQSRPSR